MEPQPGTSPGTLEYWTGHVDPFVVVGGGAGVVFVSAWQPTFVVVIVWVAATGFSSATTAVSVVVQIAPYLGLLAMLLG